MGIQSYLQSNYLSKSTVKVGIAGFTIYAGINITSTNTKEVTEIAVEDGSYISDHINIKPLTLILSGEIGQRNIVEELFDDIFDTVYEPIAKINNFGGNYTANQTSLIASVLGSARSQVSFINSKLEDGQYFANQFGVENTDLNDDQKEIQDFLYFTNGLRNSKDLVQIETPFEILKDMAITSIAITKDNESSGISFSITATQVVKAKTSYSAIQKLISNNPSSTVAAQVGKVENIGVQEATATTVDESILTGLLGG